MENYNGYLGKEIPHHGDITKFFECLLHQERDKAQDADTLVESGGTSAPEPKGKIKVYYAKIGNLIIGNSLTQIENERSPFNHKNMHIVRKEPIALIFDVQTFVFRLIFQASSTTLSCQSGLVVFIGPTEIQCLERINFFTECANFEMQMEREKLNVFTTSFKKS